MNTATKQNFALIELNSGYVWWAGEADSALTACAAADRESGNGDRIYREVARSEALHDTGGGYAVHEAPAGWNCSDGQDAEQIAAVQAMPITGYYRAMPE